MTFGEIARRHAGVATGLLGWAPDIFWAATPQDWHLAWRSWAQAHGLAADASAASSSTLADLLSRFPDEANR
jgi:Phage tail assembly chaperone protein, TAC